MRHRHAHGHLAVVLFAQHPAVLPCHAHGVTAFFRDPGIVDHPRGDGPVAIQRRQQDVAGSLEHGGGVPRGVRDEVMHGLVTRAHMAGIDPGGHRLDALAIPG